MIPAAILGFSVGTVIAWWVVLRSLSHGAAELESDPMDEVQPVDVRVVSMTWTHPYTDFVDLHAASFTDASPIQTFQLDCND